MDFIQDVAKAASLARMQIELEYRLNSRDRLVPFPGSQEQARYIIYHTIGGYLRWYRYDLEERVVGALESCPPGWAFEHPEKVLSIISGGPALEHAFAPRFVSGFFPICPGATEFPGAECEAGRGCVVRQDGQAVAWAFSVRENDRCAEVAVETAPDYRRRGYARQATAAWAYHVLQEGRQAFYSHKVDNFASAALAASLGVEIYAEVVGFD